MDQVDMLVREHLEPEVAERLAGAIRAAKTRAVLLLTDADYDGTFGLVLLTEGGIEFLASDGRVVIAVRDDIVHADPRHRGSLAVTFTDGEEITFNDVGDVAWTRQFAQAVNDFVTGGPTGHESPPEGSGGHTADAEPFPEAVVSIIDGVALVGLALGLLAGFGAVIVGFAGDEYEDTDAAGIITGAVIIVFSTLQWAFFKAVSLGLTYLWRIQFELAHKADAD